MLKYLKRIMDDKSKSLKSSSILSESWSSNSINANYVPSADDYSNNVIVNRCVNIIAQAVSHVPWVVYKKKNNHLVKLDNHPIYNLLQKPNPYKGGAEFFNEVVINKLLHGNSYILAKGNNEPSELYSLNSKNMQISTKAGQIINYKYKSDNKEYIYPINPNNFQSQVLHIKNYNPSNLLYGLPTIKAAGLAIELHNNASKWNSSLLKNGARPTGALILKDNNYLTEEQFTRLQQELNDKFVGNSNAGRPLLLEGGLDWREMGINPKDMDYIQTKNSAAREIALAFGVPPQLLGINGDNTYSNMQEARIALWEETLLPLLDKITCSLTNWLGKWYGDDIVIDIDQEKISALTEKRQNMWQKISSASFMTINEKRSLVGLAPINEGDSL